MKQTAMARWRPWRSRRRVWRAPPLARFYAGAVRRPGL